jgi:hypothetical protein
MIHALLMAFLLATPLQEGTFKVSGTVIRDDKQDPAQAAQQNQIRISGTTTLIINVGAGGAFEFPNLRPGNYQLVVGPRITMSPVSVTITDKDVTGVRLVIPVTAGVNGNVTVEGSGPRPRFQVRFARVDAQGTVPAPVTATANPGFTSTLEAGQYRITATGLPTGYSLKSITLDGADVLTQPLTVTAGASQTLSITLGVSSPPPWVSVSGRVTGGSATSVTMTGGASPEPLTAVVSANGAFTFPTVLPGNYAARTLPAIAVAGTTPITVGSTNLTNVELRIPATKEVSGKITLRGNFPMPRLSLSLTSVGAAIPPAPANILNGVVVVTPTAGGTTVPTNPGPDGAFKVVLPDGERRVTIVPGSLPPGYILESFTYGSQDLLKDPIRIALSDTAGFAITVDASNVKPHNISGKVTGLLTTRGVRVVLQGGNLGTGVESPVAPDGSFAFKDILPGNYSARISLSGPTISTSVRLDNQDVTNLTINFPRRFYIGAQVLVEGDTARVPNVPPLVLEARSATGAVATSSAATGAPSPLVITVSDGEHKVSVRSLPAGYTLKSIRYGEIDLMQQPLKVDGPITWEIVVRLVKTAG